MAEQTSTPVPDDLKARVKSSYDAIAVHYNTNFTPADGPIRLKYVEKFLSFLKLSDSGNAKVLELGCGAGLPGTKALLDNEEPRIHVTANDISRTQLDLAKHNLSAYEERLELVEGDMMALDFPPQSLDAVIGLYSIIHLPREEQTILIGRITSWLKPGGMLLTNFAENEREVVIQETWLEQEKGWMFWSAWGKDKSVKMVEDAGLEILIKEVSERPGDSNFWWIVGRKK